MLSTSEIPIGLDGLKVVEDAACMACCCVCDDIALRVEGSRVVEARNACALGRRWFSQEAGGDGPVCWIDAKPTALEAGIQRAAEILARAKYPILYGLSDTTSEAQRAAVGLIDWIGGIVDTPTGLCQGPTGVAFQGVGEVTCTLGELRNRGDVIILWGANPLETHPRHFSKFSLTPCGQFVPRGRNDRYVAHVDVRRNESTAACDEFIGIKPEADFEVLWVLRALAKGLDLDAAQVEHETGVAIAVWQALVERMKSARFGVFLYGAGLTAAHGKYLNTEALLALTRDLNAFTRFVAKPLRERGNSTGADNVLTWRTGFPFGVNHARGYPRFNPGEYTADDVLSRREADAAIVVADDAMSDLNAAARAHLRSIPYVALAARDTPTLRHAAVAFRTAIFGLNVPGTVYRMDDVPLPLRPAFDSPYPSDQEILERIERRVLELRRPSL